MFVFLGEAAQIAKPSTYLNEFRLLVFAMNDLAAHYCRQRFGFRPSLLFRCKQHWTPALFGDRVFMCCASA
jgi:hypothetical protein